jgi:5-formyltetrahydrofolate cyclo-ligase
MTKSEARQTVQARLQSMPAEEKNEASARVRALLLSWMRECLPRRIAFFASMPDEPALAPLLPELTKLGLAVACPRIENNHLHFHFISSWEDCAPGLYRIPEPMPHTPIATPDTFDLVLVPGRAFDTSGHRLGRGKGYYDRFLHRLPPTTQTLGIFFACQQLTRVPREPHDIPLHALVNEKGIITPSDPAYVRFEQLTPEEQQHALRLQSSMEIEGIRTSLDEAAAAVLHAGKMESQRSFGPF